MNKRLLLLLIPFYSLCLRVHAQTDSTKQKRWSFGIGVLAGVNQLRPSSQVHYDKVENHSRAALVGEVSVQYNLNRKWAISLGGRLGKKNAYSVFNKDNTPFSLLVEQMMLEVPFLIGYRWESIKQKEIVTIEAGILAGTSGSTFHTTFNDMGTHYTTVPDVRTNENHYYSAIIKLNKFIALTGSYKLKASLEYDLSFYTDSPIQIAYYTPKAYVNDEINLHYQTLYLNLALIF